MGGNANPSAPLSTENAARGEVRLHPFIYRITLGLAVVLALGIYGFAGGTQKYNGLVLAAAILFVFALVCISLVLRRIGRRRQTTAGRADPFSAWLNREVEICGGHLKGREAIATILIPLVAAAASMVIFAVELHLVVHR